MENKNRIISELETMRQMDYAEGRKFQAVAYQKAIQQLKAFQGEVTSAEDVADLPGIGAKIKLKIQEILTTGGLAAAAKAREDPKFSLYDTLLKIYGVGPAKAKSLMAEGIKSLEELRGREDLLTAAQKIGLQYYNDFTLRIPREEMKKHEETILGSLDKAFKGQVVGSYRRGAADSGDIDVLLTLPDTMSEADRVKLFTKTVKELQKGYMKGVLAFGKSKCLCVSQLDGKPARRLDLLMVPQAEFAYAILYFTGSDLFNVAFRAHALEKGYTMNEHGMTPTATGPVPPFMKEERDIFTFLGLAYVEPQNRKGKTDVTKL